MNAGIQGLAADIFKSALVRLDRALSSAGSPRASSSRSTTRSSSRRRPTRRSASRPTIVDALTHAAQLSVPLEVSLAWGESWAAAKG